MAKVVPDQASAQEGPAVTAAPSVNAQVPNLQVNVPTAVTPTAPTANNPSLEIIDI